jgi:hypothetical protein
MTAQAAELWQWLETRVSPLAPCLFHACCRAVLLQVVPGSPHPQLAATGVLRSVDPDRLVVKKIVLTGE